MPTDSAKTYTGFLGSLMQAHARIEERLRELERAADALANRANGPKTLETMASVLEFFSTFALDHQNDEEKILFPRLKPLPAFAQMLGALDFQHRMNEKEQGTLAACIENFSTGRERELHGLAHRFAELQRAHMLAEERALFPLVEQNLSKDALDAMSRELRTAIA